MLKNNQFQFAFKQDIETIQLAQVEPNQTVNHQRSQLGDLFFTSMPLAILILEQLEAFGLLILFCAFVNPMKLSLFVAEKDRIKKDKKLVIECYQEDELFGFQLSETVKRMDVTTMLIRVEVYNAYAKGGTPLNLQAIANVKISSNPDVVGNAIERFLDRDRSEVIRVAKETLEGNLRGIVATLTPEQVNEDRLQFAERIASDISRDLMKLGLEIDTLKIQNVSDDVDYLNSLSRERIALIIRDAEIAESNALSEAEQIEAECEEQAAVAKTQDRIIVIEQENDLRKVKAKLEQKAKTEEEITTAAAKEKRAKIEQTLQAVRAESERLRLEADEVLPAQAQKQAKELRSKGEAAVFEENAKAAALVNEMLSQVWQQTGTDTAELFLIQQLETVLEEAVQIPQRLHLRNINVVDNGDGKSVSALIKIYPEIVSQFLGSVKQILGIDVVGTLTQNSLKAVPNGHVEKTTELPLQGNLSTTIEAQKQE